MAAIVSLLCAVTSLICMILLGLGYRRTRSKMLFWSAWCFVGLAVNNALLFCDLVLFVNIDLQFPRLLAAVAGMMVLLYGFIWDAER